VGLKFVFKKNIILFNCSRDSPDEKPIWKATLVNQTKVILKSGISARRILEFMGENDFIQINQSTIVNANYISRIEFSTKECFLLSPAQEIRLNVSKAHLAKIKGKWDRL
jgi:DNA-binding LytR/AlgR family response regulator